MCEFARCGTFLAAICCLAPLMHVERVIYHYLNRYSRIRRFQYYLCQIILFRCAIIPDVSHFRYFILWKAISKSIWSETSGKNNSAAFWLDWIHGEIALMLKMSNHNYKLPAGFKSVSLSMVTYAGHFPEHFLLVFIRENLWWMVFLSKKKTL